jgi:hypothetical protein
MLAKKNKKIKGSQKMFFLELLKKHIKKTRHCFFEIVVPKNIFFGKDKIQITTI